MPKSRKPNREVEMDAEESSSVSSDTSSSENEMKRKRSKGQKCKRKNDTKNKKKCTKSVPTESEDSSSDSSSSTSSSSSSTTSSTESSDSSQYKSEGKSIKRKTKQINHKSETKQLSPVGAKKVKLNELTLDQKDIKPKTANPFSKMKREDNDGNSRRHRSKETTDRNRRDKNNERRQKSIERRNRSTERRDKSIERRPRSRDQPHSNPEKHDRTESKLRRSTERYDKHDRSGERRGSRERSDRDRCWEKDNESSNRGRGFGRYNSERDRRNHTNQNFNREQRFGISRDDRERYSDRYTEQARGRRDDWNSRGNRYNSRRQRSRSASRSPKFSSDDKKQKSHSNHQHPQRQQQRDHEWGKPSDNGKTKKSPSPDPAKKEKPNFALSGALAEDTNKVNGVVVKYTEPLEARKPKRRWRLYPFKGETALPTLHIHRQSCFLVGRERKVVDIAVDHPSCSKQHAALQYRLVPFQREDGSTGKRVRLYLIDLDSANGTFLNNKQIDPRKYYELMEKDVIKFGFSTREYVLLHENSKEDQEDDDVHVKEEPVD